MAGLVPATQKRRRQVAIRSVDAAHPYGIASYLGGRDKPGHDGQFK